MSDYMPMISVVMGCYNSENTIQYAIDSILNQTFSDFEFIIIDDHSTDRTYEICQSYEDKRIICIQNAENKGLGYSLHIGLQHAKGKYIARMDADDLSHPDRLKVQYDYLEKHQEIICVGTRARKIGNISLFSKMFSKNINTPLDHEDIKAHLLLGTPLLHPSVMFNATLLRKKSLNYNPNFRKAQDYELWSRMIWIGKMTNIKKILLYYRFSPNQASNISRSEQVNNSKIVYKRMFMHLLNRELTDNELHNHILFATRNKLSEKEFELVENWLEFLIPYIKRAEYYNEDFVKNIFVLRRAVLCRNTYGFIRRGKIFLSNKYYRTFNYRIIIRLFL